MKTDFDCWVEWKERCALDLCAEDVRQYLGMFAQARFRKHLKAVDKDVQAPEDPDLAAPGRKKWGSWHWFETAMAVKATLEGKAYKDWLFDRLNTSAKGTPVDVIQGGATLILRDVVRDYCLKEGWTKARKRGAMWSMDQEISVKQDGDGLTLKDLLPDQTLAPMSAIDREFYTKEGAKVAGDVFTGMDLRERVLLLAHFLDITITRPEVIKSAGCKKSQAYKAMADFEASLKARLKRAYKGEELDSIITLEGFVVMALRELLFSWGKSEKQVVPLFSLMEAMTGACYE